MKFSLLFPLLFVVYFAGQSLSSYNARRISNLTALQVGRSRYAGIQGRQTLQDRTLSFNFYKKGPHSVRSTLRPGFPSPKLMQHTGAKISVPPRGVPVEITRPANAQPVGKLEKPLPWNSLRLSPIGVYHL